MVIVQVIFQVICGNVIKYIAGKSKNLLPKAILHQGSVITSLCDIAGLACKFYIDKVSHIRANFRKVNVNPLYFLHNLIPCVENKFKLPLITNSETLKYIKHSKNSSASGHDLLTMRIQKKCAKSLAPHFTHMINSSIKSSIFPSIYKISKISPYLKNSKPANCMDSYRPVNNLCTGENIYEAHLKNHIITHLTANNIIIKKHHGARSEHSAMTALTYVHNTIHTHQENNHFTALFQTDLSSAYDTIDTIILLQKMEYYGICDAELKLFTSYLSERSQLVQIEIFKSNILPMPHCSVIQGSSISSILYNIYTNEIPLLHRLMTPQHYYNITNEMQQNNTTTIHDTTQYVDDSSNIISSNDTTTLSNYMTNYYEILSYFYDSNKLKINGSKTRLLLFCKPKNRDKLKDFSFKAGIYTIKQQLQCKVLGTIVTNDLKHDRQTSLVVSKVNQRLSSLRDIRHYTSFSVRQLLANSLILSVITYAIPLFINASDSNLRQLNKLLVNTSRFVKGNYGLRLSHNALLKNIGWVNIYRHISICLMKYLHNIFCPLQ